LFVLPLTQPSPKERALKNLLPETTHPDCASLVDPLFAFGGKRVRKRNFFPVSR